MKKIHVIVLLLVLSQVLSAQQTVGLFFNDTQALNGYTLIAPSSETKTYLIDNCGFVVHTWEASNYFPGASVYLLENGNLLRTGRLTGNFGGGGLGGKIELFSWEDELLWSYDYATDEYHQHHDVALMPNGNVLLIAWELHTNQEAIEAGLNPNSTNGKIWSEKVVEVQANGTNSGAVVWEWRLWDHLIQNYDSSKANYGVVYDHPELLDINFGITGSSDWIHFNSIEYHEDLDQILLSSKHLNEIYIIDHSTTTVEAASHSGGNSGKGGDFIYRWGNPMAYDRGLEEDRKLFGQHDARWIPDGYPDEGKIMLYNNGLDRPDGDYSTVDVIDPVFENNEYFMPIDGLYQPLELFWFYEATPTNTLFSSTLSGAQRLSNGNTLICEGRPGNLYEVTYDGEIVWHYRVPINNNGPVSQGTTAGVGNIFRATRYGTDYPAFMDKDLEPTIPIELNPLPSTCEIVGLQELSDLNNISILNNPFREFLKIKNQEQIIVLVEIFDLFGRPLVVIEGRDEMIEINTRFLENGTYVVKITDEEKNQYLSKIIIKQ